MLKTLILVKLLGCQSNLWNWLAYIVIDLLKFYSINPPYVISRAGFATDYMMRVYKRCSRMAHKMYL